MTTVTQEERETFEAIRLKMLADQDVAVAEFAELLVEPETTSILESAMALQARCVMGSQQHTQIGNLILVINSLKGQFPVAPAVVPEV